MGGGRGPAEGQGERARVVGSRAVWWGLLTVIPLKAVASFPGWIVRRRQPPWSIRFLEAISDRVVGEDAFSTPLSGRRMSIREG